MELTTLCYVQRGSDIPEEKTYFETVGDLGRSYFRTTDISKAMFRPAEEWDNTIKAEYAYHADLWYSQILLVYVEVKEVPKKGWDYFTEFEYVKTIREGEDLLAKYRNKRKTLQQSVEKITLDLPIFSGTCYLIRNRQDLVNLVELHPFDQSLSNQLYGIEDIIRTQAVDNDSEAKAIEDFRNNFYLPGDMTHDKILLPAVIEVRKLDSGTYCTTYTVKELKDLVETCKRTVDTKLTDI